MDEDNSQIKNFIEVTGTNQETAKMFLFNAKYKVNVAIDAFFERYAPISSGSSDEFGETGIEIDDNGNFVQKCCKKRPIVEEDLDPLIISSDEENEVVFVSEQRAKIPKIEIWEILEEPVFSDQSSPCKIKRKILIDGSNVAVTYAKALHGRYYKKHNRNAFSVEGLEICINYFKSMGFQVRAIVPEYRLKHDKSSNCRLIQKMQEEGYLVATPAKSYDDEILLKGAVQLNAAVVSNDFFREHQKFNFHVFNL